MGLAGGVLGLGVGSARVAPVKAAVEHQTLDHVARDVRASQPADHTRAALARSHQDEIALVGPAAVDCGARAAAEQRLAHQEAPALLQHCHERLFEPPLRAAADGRAHCSSWTSSSSAVGSASSRLVSRSSSALTSGLSPFLWIVLPPGR